LPLPGLSIATGVSSACSTALAAQLSAKRVHQRLQLRAALAHPLRQRRARDQVAGALEDRLLAVQRQVVQELGHQHLGQQPGRGMPLSMTCGATGACTIFSQQLARPLAADVALHREHARLVVQLLGHVLANALHRGSRSRSVVSAGSWRTSRRGRLAGSFSRLGLPLSARLGRDLHALDLGSHRRQVAVQRLFEQALLFGVAGPGRTSHFGGELQSLEDGVLVRELVDDYLLERDLGARGTQCLAQLFRIQRCRGLRRSRTVIVPNLSQRGHRHMPAMDVSYKATVITPASPMRFQGRPSTRASNWGGSASACH
jgi:hypothetical protein